MDMLNKFKIQDQPEASSQIQLEANGLVKKDDLIMIIRDLA